MSLRKSIGIEPHTNLKIAGTLMAAGIAGQIAISLLLQWPTMPDELVLRPPFALVGAGTHAYSARVRIPMAKVDDLPGHKESTLQLYENGSRIGPSHSTIDDIAAHGNGRYLFFFDGMSQVVVFSSSDNSDPNGNGRRYRVFDPQLSDPYLSKPPVAHSG